MSVDLIPEQKKGGHTGATSRREAPTRHGAVQLFQECSQRLMDVNNWSKLCSNKGGDFWLTDSGGNLIQSIPKIGDLIRIKLPAPSNKKGDGYDWVRIEAFENTKNLVKDEEVFGFRTRPVQNPSDHSVSSAHFYTSDATSTFLVIRNSSVLTVMERGKNEVPNNSGSLLGRLRNFLIALPAMAGLSKPQWKCLVNGILNPPKEY